MPAGDALDTGLYLEMYKLAVEMADRTSARRAGANGFFLTLNSALIAVVGLIPAGGLGSAGIGTSSDRFGPIVLAIAGMLVSAAWWVLLRSYREINRAKFAVIDSMESHLPIALFGDEWQILHPRNSRWHVRFLELGSVERIVPLVYGGIFVAAAIRDLIS